MLALLGSGLSPATPGLAASHVCPADLSVWRQTLGAEWLACHQLADLTTTGNPYTDPNSLYGMGFPPPGSGTLNSHYTNPTGPAVAGLQLEGYFADGCNAFVAEPALVAKNGSPFVSGCTPLPGLEATCVSACHHDGQFVVRIPDTWDGHLLAAGTPGVRDAFASDFILSDYAMEKGWAYVSQDKGNLGADFFRSGCDETGSCASQPWAGACTDPSQPWCAGAAVQEWNPRMRQATRTAQALLRGLTASYALAGLSRTYAAGISNGGYQTRRALETDTTQDRLYDGGVDWEGTLFVSTLPAGVHPATRTTGFGLFNTLPSALLHAPGDYTNNAPDVQALAAVGFNPQSEPLWAYHWLIYWGLTQKAYRLEFDPEYTGYTCSANTGPPCVLPPAIQVSNNDPDAMYVYSQRLQQNPALSSRLQAVANTGDFKVPLITLHGDQDSLLPVQTDSDLYAQMVKRPGLYRYYRVAGGNHVDPQFDDHYGVDTYGNNVLRPILPCARAALDALQAWVEHGIAAPTSHTIIRPSGASAADLANTCSVN